MAFMAAMMGLGHTFWGVGRAVYKEGYKTPFQPLMPSASFLKFNEVEAGLGLHFAGFS